MRLSPGRRASSWLLSSVGLDANIPRHGGSDYASGPASVAVSAELVGLAQAFHDTAALLGGGSAEPRRPGRA